MKSLIALFAAIVLITACQNQAAEKSAATTDAGTAAVSDDPRNNTTIQWIDSAVDMGKITEGQKLEVAFRFKNTGNKPLVIKQVLPSCGCTAADVPKEPIAPGEEGVIKGVFDSSGKPGMNNKTMTVFTNTEAKQHVVSFAVDVQPTKK
jgi:hypothetical protein